jgi:hypothetical protein
MSKSRNWKNTGSSGPVRPDLDKSYWNKIQHHYQTKITKKLQQLLLKWMRAIYIFYPFCWYEIILLDVTTTYKSKDIFVISLHFLILR